MPSRHPLELPEILSHIASYVHERSLPACARVSKGWYQAFIPHIWKDVSFTPRKPEHVAMPRYSHHVKKLYVGVENLIPDLPQCPNLQSLTISRSHRLGPQSPAHYSSLACRRATLARLVDDPASTTQPEGPGFTRQMFLSRRRIRSGNCALDWNG